MRSLFSLTCFCLGLTMTTVTGAADIYAAAAELDRQVDKLVKRPEIAGLAMAVVTRDSVILARTDGVRREGSRELIDPETRFRIASLSKGFAGTLTAMLVEQEKLALTEKVQLHVPDFKLATRSAASEVTLEHVLSHRMGLPHHAHDRLLESNWQVPTIVQRFPKLKPVCSVGSCYGYQNVAFNVITDVIEQSQTADYEQLLGSMIFEPLGMMNAGIGSEHLLADENFARPHVRRSGQATPVKVRTHYYLVPAAAGVNLSLIDLMTWAQAHLGNRPDVLSPTLLKSIRSPLTVTNREMQRGGWRAQRLDSAHYGLGWRIYDFAGHPVYFHAGAVEGYGAQIAIFPDRGVAVVAMWNSSGSRTSGITPIFADALYDQRQADWMKLGRGFIAGS